MFCSGLESSVSQGAVRYLGSQTVEATGFTGTCDLRTEMKDNASDLEGKRDEQNKHISSSQPMLRHLDAHSYDACRDAVWPGL